MKTYENYRYMLIVRIVWLADHFFFFFLDSLPLYLSTVKMDIIPTTSRIKYLGIILDKWLTREPSLNF